MELKEFINQKVEMLKNDFSKGQIKQEIYEYCFKNYMPNTPLTTVINLCMDIYGEVIKIYSENEWININDKLPEKGGHYLIRCPTSFPKNYRGVIAEFYEDNQLFYGESSEEIHEDATHWKNLPFADF